MVDSALTLGGLYLKVAQHACNRTDLDAPAELLQPFQRLFGWSVETVDVPRLKEQCKQLCRDSDSEFKFLEVLKMGSIAQCALFEHGGVLKVLKTVNPGLEDVYRADIIGFGTVLAALETVFGILGIERVRSVAKLLVDALTSTGFTEDILSEFDLEQEAANLMAASELQRSLSALELGHTPVVPQVFAASTHALLMSYAVGDQLH